MKALCKLLATHTIFNPDALLDLLQAEVQDYMIQEYGDSAWQEGATLDGYEVKHLKYAIQKALEKIKRIETKNDSKTVGSRL